MRTKISFLIISLLIFALSNAQVINFADSNFKNTLLLSSTASQMAGSGIVSGTIPNLVPENYIKIDTNNDGEIQQNEALLVTYLQIGGSSISNFSGIEYFVNLKYLNIYGNSNTAIGLSTLTQLEFLDARNCPLTSLNLTGLLNLKGLFCTYNQITNLDFSGLLNLRNVACGHTLINNLDFMNNPLFDKLDCRNNPNLTSIKIKNGTLQQFVNLGNCLFDGNPNLHYICADAAEIPLIQSFQATCAVNNTCVIDSACELGVEGFNENKVGVYPNPSSGLVYLDNTNSSFNTVQVYNSIGQLISTQTLSVSASASIDLSGCSKGVYLLNFQGEKGGKSCKVVKD